MAELGFVMGGLSYTYENGVTSTDPFPPSNDPVIILGKKYSSVFDHKKLKKVVQTLPWFTYRKGFNPIGGTGPTSDQGWGCMLRCGQMMLCQSLVNLHLPSNWTWSIDSLGGSPAYRKLLDMFLDKKSSCYSIHQIASMGVAEGKNVGQWFGPNTVAQVLKKLTSYDDWNQIVIHVAMDNTVVIEDIKSLCKTPHTSSGVNLQFESDTSITTSLYRDPSLSSHLSPHTSLTSSASWDGHVWRPLLLMVPLRLGLSCINDIYMRSLKRFFELPYTVGVLGGKPNHAHWFIGYTGDDLIFLDPHTVQPMVDTDAHDGLWDDSSYHCTAACRMNISNLDPSVALGFFCKTEQEFDDLAQILQHEKNSIAPMFEVCLKRPTHWPPLNTGNPHGTDTVFTVVPSPKYDTDDEYELV